MDQKKLGMILGKMSALEKRIKALEEQNKLPQPKLVMPAITPNRVV